MNHIRILPQGFPEDWLTAYLDRQLSREQSQKVEQALASSPELAELLKELKAGRAMVGQLPQFPQPSAAISPTAQPMNSAEDAPSNFRTFASELDDGLEGAADAQPLRDALSITPMQSDRPESHLSVESLDAASQPEPETKTDTPGQLEAGNQNTAAQAQSDNPVEQEIVGEQPQDDFVEVNQDPCAEEMFAVAHLDIATHRPPSDFTSGTLITRRWPLTIAASLIGISIIVGGLLMISRPRNGIELAKQESSAARESELRAAETSMAQADVAFDATPSNNTARVLAADSALRAPVPMSAGSETPSATSKLARPQADHKILNTPAPGFGDALAYSELADIAAESNANRYSKMLDATAEALAPPAQAAPQTIAQSNQDQSQTSNETSQVDDRSRVGNRARRGNATWHRSANWSESSVASQIQSNDVLTPLRRQLSSPPQNPAFAEADNTPANTQSKASDEAVPIAVLAVPNSQQRVLATWAESVQLQPGVTEQADVASRVLFLTNQELQRLLDSQPELSAQLFWITPTQAAQPTEQRILIINQQ
ncbi:MAG: zf-HC2 domain-containing protein [Pirellulaceae bacterium]|nr:zf-HC2 domain-containing protein [Pirellulaceae bacterium]